MKTKAGTNRTVPIHPRIRPLVIKWYNKAQELNSEYLFNCTDTNTAKSNLMLTYDKYRRRIEALVDALELNPDHRPHDSRNTFITMCKNAGVDEYAIKNGVGGSTEFLIAILIGIIGGITPAILLGAGTIKFILALIIWVITILLCVYFIRRFGVINKSSMSVLIEDKDDLYYMMIAPNLRGSMFPKSFTTLLAGPSAIFTENKIDAEIEATGIAQDDETVKALFELYKSNELKTTFGTVMYGKPVYISKILEKNFKDSNKKIYKVNCVKDNGNKSTVKIPKVYPTFFK